MVYKIIFKKRFQNKLEKLFRYIENEFGLLVAHKFADELEGKLKFLRHQPFIGNHLSLLKTPEALLLVSTIAFIIEYR